MRVLKNLWDKKEHAWQAWEDAKMSWQACEGTLAEDNYDMKVSSALEAAEKAQHAWVEAWQSQTSKSTSL